MCLLEELVLTGTAVTAAALPLLQQFGSLRFLDVRRARPSGSPLFDSWLPGSKAAVRLGFSVLTICAATFAITCHSLCLRNTPTGLRLQRCA